MYYQKFIDFLKNHNIYDEKTFEFWKNNRVLFDYRDEDQRYYLGCYYQYQNGYLTKIELRVPFIDNDKTVLINIHEYIHLLLLYKNIGKKYGPKEDQEVLPFFYEVLYLKENETEELKKYYNYLNETIKTEKIDKYVLALELSQILLDNYNKDNIIKLDKKVKRLIKKRNKHS